MAFNTNRRTFIKTATVASAGYWAAGGVQAQESKSPNEQIQFGCVGVSGKGSSDSADAGRNGKVLAVCDVDKISLMAGKAKLKAEKSYADFRIMLEEMGDKIDAVTVSTPDHMHTPVGLMAMRMGLHCFCQKPLTRTIYEARLMADTAREMGVETMMGNQGTAGDGLREAAALIKGGILGDIKSVNVWSNRPVWPQGPDADPKPGPCPPTLDWDLWLGVAKDREYAPGYHPFKWRGYWDFGSGALGDMACHTVNMPFAGCDLADPTAVQATTSGHNGYAYPSWSQIKFWFPANDWRGPIDVTWADGSKRPDESLMDDFVNDKGEKIGMQGSGAVVVGSKGKLYSPDDYGGKYFLAGAEKIAVDYEKSPGHFTEWVNAIKGKGPAMSNFPNYAGRLTETILLGNLAVWAANEAEVEGPKVLWDAKKLECTNMPELNTQIVKPTYRDGYILDV